MKQKKSQITDKTLNKVESSEHIVSVVQENLKEIRQKSGLSLDKLAIKCGVSRAMLSQIEQGKSTPTISVLWKIANGLNIPFSDLLKENNAESLHIIKYENSKILFSNSKVFSSRALFPFGANRQTEFYELVLKPGGIEIAEPHMYGTTENIVVVTNKLRIRIGEKNIDLDTKDSILFRADVPHEYINQTDKETIMYLVMNYKRDVG